MSHNTLLAKNTLFLSGRMVIVLFMSLYTSRVFLNALGVMDYGISNVVAGFVSMFSFLNSSLSNSIQRYYNAELVKNGKEGATKVFSISLIIQCFLSLLVLFLLETIGLWYLFEKMVIPQDRFWTAFWLFQFSAISASIVIVKSPFSAPIMAYEHMNVYAYISVLDVVLKLLFAISLQYVTYDRLFIFGLFSLLITILNFGLVYYYSKSHFDELYFVKIKDWSLAKGMLSFSGWNFLGTFACLAREQGVNLILNLFFGPTVNAARGVAYQVSGALQGFVVNLSVAAKPQMIKSYAIGDSTKTIKLMYTMSKLSFIFLLVLSLPIMLNLNFVLHLWLGDAVPDHTASFIIFVLMATYMNNLNAPLSNVVYATGNMRNYELTFSSINFLILPLSYIVLSYGARPEAVFVVYFILTIFVQIGCLLVVGKLVKMSLLHYFFKLVIPLSIVAVVTFLMANILHLFLSEGIVRMLIDIVFLGLISSTLFFFIALDAREKDVLKTIVKKIKIIQR